MEGLPLFLFLPSSRLVVAKFDAVFLHVSLFSQVMLTAWRQICNTPTYVTPSLARHYILLLLFLFLISLHTRESRTATGQERSTVPLFSQRKGTMGEKKELGSPCGDAEKGRQKHLSIYPHLAFSFFFLFFIGPCLSSPLLSSPRRRSPRPTLNSSTLPAHAIKTWKPRNKSLSQVRTRACLSLI